MLFFDPFLLSERFKPESAYFNPSTGRIKAVIHCFVVIMGRIVRVIFDSFAQTESIKSFRIYRNLGIDILRSKIVIKRSYRNILFQTGVLRSFFIADQR